MNEQVCAAFLPNTASKSYLYRFSIESILYDKISIESSLTNQNVFIIRFLLETNVKPAVSESTKTDSALPINTVTLAHLDVNLLKDDQWIKTNFSLEKIPDGCEPLYDESNQFLSAWATSYDLGTFRQDNVKLIEGTQSPVSLLILLLNFPSRLEHLIF